MKKSIFTVVLLTLLMTAPFTEVFSQDEASSSLPKFLILIETTQNGIKLTGKEGCEFKELTFSSKPHYKQAIDQNGMTSLKKDSTAKPGKLPGFKFTIEKTDSGISLVGINGTAWKTLSFTCQHTGCYQYIDQLGMTKAK